MTEVSANIAGTGCKMLTNLSQKQHKNANKTLKIKPAVYVLAG